MAGSHMISLALLCALLALGSPLVSGARLLKSRRELSTSLSHSHTDTSHGSTRHLTACLVGCSNILQSAAAYGVLAARTITNQQYTVINGNLGLSPGSSVVGFPPGQVVGSQDVDNALAVGAQSDAHNGYAVLVSMAYPAANDLSGDDLGGRTFAAGKYFFAKSAQLTGNLTFDAGGDPTAIFVIQTGTTFITSTASQIVLLNGAMACNIFYAVGSSAGVGDGSSFSGSIVAYASITTGQTASVTGSLIALGASISLRDNIVTAPGACAGPVSPPPPPSPPHAASPPPSKYSPPPLSSNFPIIPIIDVPIIPIIGIPPIL